MTKHDLKYELSVYSEIIHDIREIQRLMQNVANQNRLDDYFKEDIWHMRGKFDVIYDNLFNKLVDIIKNGKKE